MNETLERLITLQAIALEMESLHAEWKRLPTIVAAARKDLEGAQTALNRVQNTIAEEEALRQRQGTEAGQYRAKLAKLKTQMDSATSTQQATALEHEILFAQEAISRLEEEEFASMERSEAAEAERALKIEAVAKSEEVLKVREQIAAQGREDAEKDLALREAEQKELRSHTEEDALSLFDRLSKSRGTAVSEALHEQCSACRMKIRPQRWSQLTGREHQDELIPCENCSRILFWDLRNDRPGSWPAGDRLRRALTLDKKA